MSSDKMTQHYNVAVVRGREIELCGDSGGNPWVFNCPHKATDWAQRATYRTGIKHQVRPVKSDIDWRAREKKRFKTAHYTKLPWHKESWVSKGNCADHFAHVSRRDPKLLAYTRSADDGARDAKTATKPAAYLAKFYSGILSEDEIRSWVAKYKRLYDPDNIVRFACTPDEIVRVYTTGPNSCMSYKPGHFRSKIHPATVYAGPDLAVAYTQVKARVTARCVVWPKKKIYTRIYGDAHLLEDLLREEGYRPGDLQGARLTKIKHGERYVCPYIDSVRRVKVGRKYLTIDKNGRRVAGNQDGYCGEGFNCRHCNNEQDALKVRRVAVDGNWWCNTCYETALANNEIFRCAYSNAYWRIQNRIEMYDGTFWSRQYIQAGYAFTCMDCQKVYPFNWPRERPTKHHFREVYKNGRYGYQCVCCATRQKELPL